MVVASASVEAERSNAEQQRRLREDAQRARAPCPNAAGRVDGAIMSKNIVVNVLPDGTIDLDGESVTVKTIGAKLTAMSTRA
jgi:hypothetical protein